MAEPGIACSIEVNMENLQPIHRAAWEGDAEAIDRLVAEAAADGQSIVDKRVNRLIYLPDPNVVDGDEDNEFEDDELEATVAQGTTALAFAAARGHEAVVARLLALGADVGKEDYGGGSTAAHKAAQYGHAGVLAARGGSRLQCAGAGH